MQRTIAAIPIRNCCVQANQKNAMRKVIESATDVPIRSLSTVYLRWLYAL